MNLHLIMEKQSIIKNIIVILEMLHSLFTTILKPLQVAVFFDEKMFVVSYCMIIAFHQTINLPRIVIFRSFDKNENELYSLSHFNIIDFDFFNQNKRYFNFTTLRQLKTTASNVLQKESNTALAEMFTIELKFTVDAIKKWFRDNKKSRELDFDDKALFKKNKSLCKYTMLFM